MLPRAIPDLTEKQWAQVEEMANTPDTPEDEREREEALDLVKRLRHE